MDFKIVVYDISVKYHPAFLINSYILTGEVSVHSDWTFIRRQFLFICASSNSIHKVSYIAKCSFLHHIETNLSHTKSTRGSGKDKKRAKGVQ